MKKKIILIIFGILTLTVFSYLVVYFIQNKTLIKSFSQETNTTLNEEVQLIRCNWNIFKPEFTFVFATDDGGHMSFRESENIFWQSKENWRKNKTGGTTVQNTTFKNLLSMVKDDCYQFQKDYNWSETWGTEKEKTELRWQYSKLIKIDKEKEKKELEKQREKARKELKKQGIDPDNIPIPTNEEFRKMFKEDGFSDEDIEKMLEE